jgi:hypothetical protein
VFVVFFSFIMLNCDCKTIITCVMPIFFSLSLSYNHVNIRSGLLAKTGGQSWLFRMDWRWDLHSRDAMSSKFVTISFLLVSVLFNNLPGVNLTINDIGRSHVIGRAKSGKCQVIVRFLSYRTRNLVYTNKKSLRANPDGINMRPSDVQ